MKKILLISLKLNFTPNTLGCNGLILIRLKDRLLDRGLTFRRAAEISSTFLEEVKPTP